eukprot:4452775-Pleurochrysis_carterae.AAC.4
MIRPTLILTSMQWVSNITVGCQYHVFTWTEFFAVAFDFNVAKHKALSKTAFTRYCSSADDGGQKKPLHSEECRMVENLAHSSNHEPSAMRLVLPMYRSPRYERYKAETQHFTDYTMGKS